MPIPAPPAIDEVAPEIAGADEDLARPDANHAFMAPGGELPVNLWVFGGIGYAARTEAEADPLDTAIRGVSGVPAPATEKSRTEIRSKAGAG